MRSRLKRALGTLAPLLVSGCVMSPLPEPPQATIDPTRVFTADPSHRGEGLSGGPGAAAPAGALLRIFDLDSEEAPVEGIIEDDGSFAVDLLVDIGQELRLQVVADQTRSTPLDVVTGEPGSSLVLSERPLSACLILDPPVELDLETTHEVSVENRCDQEVELLTPRLRSPLAGVELGVGRVWPEVVPPGGALTVEVRVEPGWASEEIFFIESTRPERDRRPITIVPPPSGG